MLSYRHAFHAGNHADVLKHTVELLLLDYLNQKDKPYWYIDTHAGAGCYRLDEGYASKNAEFNTGIGPLWQRDDLPEPLARYVELVRGLNPDGELRFYPGSPFVAARVIRRDDKLRLFELHPTDGNILTENFSDAGRRALVTLADGFAGLKSVLPPPPRRALVLIDPPYEDKRDYHKVETALATALQRFPAGLYAVWYPCLQRAEAKALPQALRRLAPNWLDVSLHVETPARDGFGMAGSGMFIINPPWTLPDTLKSLMPWLVKALGRDAGAGYRLDWHIN
ncbi:23S rRNA (adenine(2030)-N(6))-methyltransferase RlmJ [Laribacter hongkongensis]|uniref:23S rRNA (adenine(2030)-N(6))-methyltransferase RlmJ n=1 Tax=Laribacter hongkongensis TaxID=168471 RepID=UPI001EFEDC33|nr:23S rRNA (adenine(2030)-N(6))-methyltransferase RlmJ [Laribacter hongkongensis]MCG9096533.1 23S rRNA (adenine(2030)-N(6))-methyltransferase RlmJ [Laribacter hongkongensis]